MGYRSNTKPISKVSGSKNATAFTYKRGMWTRYSKVGNCKTSTNISMPNSVYGKHPPVLFVTLSLGAEYA